MRNFLTRSLVALVGIPALLWIFDHGGTWLSVLVSVLVMLSCYEIWQAVQLRGINVSLWMLTLVTVAIPLVVWHGSVQTWITWAWTAILLSAVWVVWRRDAVLAALIVLVHLGAALWVGVGFGALIALRTLEPGQGFRWLVFLFANLWIGDTAAYLVGSWIKGPKLSPTISPRKTIAGALAQVLTSALIGGAYILAGWIAAPSGLLITSALTIAIVGQIGDLFESTFKRAVGLKDFSSIIPGHGGVLDRFDSTLFSAPALWILVRLWVD